MNKIKADVSKQCLSHKCLECKKKLYTGFSWSNVIAYVVFMIFMIGVIALSGFQTEEPFCAKRTTIGELEGGIEFYRVEPLNCDDYEKED